MPQVNEISWSLSSFTFLLLTGLVFLFLGLSPCVYAPVYSQAIFFSGFKNLV